jgi:murein L,D-transpeptidase YafK
VAHAHAATPERVRAATEPLARALPVKRVVDPAPLEVTRIHVSKSAHALEMWAGDELVLTLRAAVGSGGAGPKHHEGDNVTPTGRYHVVARSLPGDPGAVHAALLLDYPNDADRGRFVDAMRAGELGPYETIGGGIAIHGGTLDGWMTARRTFDWTQGCVALTDAQIDEIAPRIKVGVVVDIDD